MAASVVARRALLASLRTARFGYRQVGLGDISRQTVRSFQTSFPVYKKKNKGAVSDNLFEEEGEGEDSGDLFKDELPVSMSTAPPEPTQPPSPPPLPSKRTKLSPEDRRERYDLLLGFVKPRLGRKPEMKQPQVRNSAWTNLVGLAMTQDQLHELVELFPLWKDLGRAFHPRFSELFTRRCVELSCPLLALDVFGNYAKYNLKLTPPAGRQLLRALHAQHPIDKLIAASALYSVYGLTPISQDLVACSILVSACFEHKTKESLKVAHALLPHMKRMLGVLASEENITSQQTSGVVAVNIEKKSTGH